jgi:cell wall-associated NlpC family hydrolase
VNTLGWLFILTALLLIRQVSKGRVMSLGEDLSDAFIAIASGDQKALGEVFARKGDGTKASTALDPLARGLGDLAAQTGVGLTGAVGNLADQVKGNVEGIQKEINANVALWAIKLGTAAKGYRFTATGPDYYDCSGLMWRAVQKVGYKGTRFTTASVALRKGFVRLADPELGVSVVTTGDLVVWPGRHMGVVTTPGRFYSARSVESGIGEANIAGFLKGHKPIYLRYVK